MDRSEAFARFLSLLLEEERGEGIPAGIDAEIQTAGVRREVERLILGMIVPTPVEDAEDQGYTPEEARMVAEIDAYLRMAVGLGRELAETGHRKHRWATSNSGKAAALVWFGPEPTVGILLDPILKAIGHDR